MNKMPISHFRNWFGYNRRERRASFFILLLTAGIAGVRYIIPDSGAGTEIIPVAPSMRVTDSTGVPEKKIYVRQSGTKVRSGGSIPARKVIDLNSCDSTALEKLPGIGPVLARRIIKYRNLLGGFAYVEQLKEVYGLRDSTYKLISDRLSADPAAVRRIDINKADFRQLIRLPYFEKYEVSSILKYRDLEGSIKNIDELVNNKLITAEKAGKIRAYVIFGE